MSVGSDQGEVKRLIRDSRGAFLVHGPKGRSVGPRFPRRFLAFTPEEHSGNGPKTRSIILTVSLPYPFLEMRCAFSSSIFSMVS